MVGRGRRSVVGRSRLVDGGRLVGWSRFVDRGGVVGGRGSLVDRLITVFSVIAVEVLSLGHGWHEQYAEGEAVEPSKG